MCARNEVRAGMKTWQMAEKFKVRKGVSRCMTTKLISLHGLLPYVVSCIVYMSSWKYKVLYLLKGSPIFFDYHLRFQPLIVALARN